MACIYMGFVLYGIFHLYQQWRIERIENRMDELDTDIADLTQDETDLEARVLAHEQKDTDALAALQK